ncbi:unnamed protein product [Leptidea sinapis]|uniref:Death domain-containing protein n=1 Tax=Leptidea sinapis TaxID=189913 RepID=A0A5E4R7J2_9NEOP|nr:unnamed protein product [Leptidea sinapis]
MQRISNDQLNELEKIVTKLPLPVISKYLMIETGIEWRYISQAVRKAKMPMVPGSIAKILCKFVSKNLTPEELAETVSKFRLIYFEELEQ